MSDNCSGPPTSKDIIHTIRQHHPLFQYISEHPRAGIHLRFDLEYARVLAYQEAEVLRCSRIVDEALGKPFDAIVDDTPSKVKRAMRKLTDMLLLHQRLVQAAGSEAAAPSPTMHSLNDYRARIGEGPGIGRAANGEPCSMYGKQNERVPPQVATIYDEDLGVVAQGIVNHLMNPFLELVRKPVWDLLVSIPVLGKRLKKSYPSTEFVDARTIAMIAVCLVVMTAALPPIAAIATLDAIHTTGMRIFAMFFFALASALPVQFLGARYVPVYTLIIAYFSAMVMFIGTGSDRNHC